MNILAHIYLSYNNDDLLLGNCIGDFVKGKQYESYPTEVQKGILYHRKIDAFTDSHELVKKTNALFRGSQGHYSGVAVDLLFDHIRSREIVIRFHIALPVP